VFKEIYQNEELISIIVSYCEENNIEICLSRTLNENSDDNLLILKIDNFFNSQKMHNPPPSVDCLILVKCDECVGYDIYLVELKDINSAKKFDKNNIIAKFKTTIDDFLTTRFKEIFEKENYCNFKCYFVSDPYNCSNLTQEEYDKKIRVEGLKLDYFNNIKPFKFQDKIAMIEPRLPNPMIDVC